MMAWPKSPFLNMYENVSEWIRYDQASRQKRQGEGIKGLQNGTKRQH